MLRLGTVISLRSKRFCAHRWLLALALAASLAAPAFAQSTAQVNADNSAVRALCRKISNKLNSVSYGECLQAGLKPTGAVSVGGEAILARDFLPANGATPRARVLLIGGIHGDELSSVSVVFKWIAALAKTRSNEFHFRIAPLVNPDGLLRKRSRRMNANGVDLNRNFPCPEWFRSTQDYWVRRTSRNPRRYPGPAPLSEPESRWLVHEIFDFDPQVIISVHAPFSVVDFDGPSQPPDRLGSLYLKLLGTYPGSLGRYAGTRLSTPVLTIEFKSAGIMPPVTEQKNIWRDLIHWLGEYTEEAQLTAASAANVEEAEGNEEGDTAGGG